MTDRVKVSAEWYTPKSIFDALGMEFDVDAASPFDPVPWVPAKSFISQDRDGLVVPWRGSVWLNPPYGRGIEPWIEKMESHGDGVLLTMVRTDTRWWQRAAAAADAICFIRGRVQFIPGADQPATRRSPTDRPGASNCLFAFGPRARVAVKRCGLGMVFGRN